jgi:hypothetical protein
MAVSLGRLAAAVAFVRGSSSAVLPAVLPVVLTRVLRAASQERPRLLSAPPPGGAWPRALAPSLTTADSVVTYIQYES